jgi:predicted acyl esterase
MVVLAEILALGCTHDVSTAAPVVPIATLNGVEIVPLPAGIRVENDLSIPMADGVKLSANLFLPSSGGPVPVLVALIPYGKDTPTEKSFIEQEKDFNEYGLSFGKITVSENTPFEAPDPAYWVPKGYAVLHVDLRGFGKSGGTGTFGLFTSTDVSDFKEIVEWAGTQPWSTGSVGLIGVSYLAISQWFAAGQTVPHLKAICPWEGASDEFADVLFHEGVPGTPGPGQVLPPLPSAGGAETTFTMGGAMLSAFPPALIQAYVPAPNLGAIDVPALICGSYSDQGLHTRGSFRGFETIASKQKWLYTHGGGKWERFYGADGVATQSAFFDHFLKGDDNGWEATPPVRLEVRRTRDDYSVRTESAWPPASVRYVPMFLDASAGSIVSALPGTQATHSYVSTADDSASFDLKFDAQTEITGPMSLKLWVSTDQGSDMDLFVALQKLDANGTVVPFWGTEKDPNGVVARGWLRVSYRALDPQKSTPSVPVISYANAQTLTAGEIVSGNIEILPSSTLFEAGETLRLVVRGTDVFSSAYHPAGQPVNQGMHTVYTGGAYDSQLLVPIVGTP